MRRKELELEVERLKLKIEILNDTVNEIVTAYRSIQSDMKEHDDEYEKLVAGMTNMMNYSYSTALEAEKHD